MWSRDQSGRLGMACVPIAELSMSASRVEVVVACALRDKRSIHGSVAEAGRQAGLDAAAPLCGGQPTVIGAADNCVRSTCASTVQPYQGVGKVAR